MLRILSVLAIVLTATPGIAAAGKANQLTLLSQASQTAMIQEAGLQVVAYYARQGDVLDLTILVTDQEGDTLRTRIALKDRQHHVLLIPAAERDGNPVRIEFLRTADQVEMMVSDDDEQTSIAGYVSPVRF